MPDDGTKIGTVTHYFDKLGVGIIKLEQELKKGDGIKLKGNKTDFTQTVGQIQFDHKDIDSASVGQEVGVKLDGAVRQGDGVYRHP